MRKKFDGTFEVIRIPNVAFDFGWWDQFSARRCVYFDGPKERVNQHTYVAMNGINILGMLLVQHDTGSYLDPHDKGTVRSYGTLVRPPYRRLGVAKALWRKMIECEKPTHIRMSTVSDMGYTMQKALQREHPYIKWESYQEGNRGLRDLRKVRRARPSRNGKARLCRRS